MKAKTIDAAVYTFEGEKQALQSAIVVLIFVMVAVFAISLGVAAIFVGLGLAFVWVKQSQLLGNAPLVSESSFPRVHRSLDLVCSRLGVSRPRVHVPQDPTINAFAVGFFEPFSVGLNSATIDAMDDDELNFVLGHELGHIKSRHTTVLSFTSTLGSTFLGSPFQLVFGPWMRKAEHTADRAGLLACQNLEAAVRAMIKMASGPRALEHTDVREFLRQADQVNASEAVRFSEFFGTHPYVTNRIMDLERFYRSAIYQTFRAGCDAQVALRECSNCRRHVQDPTDSFCRNCGSMLEEPTVPADSMVAEGTCPKCGENRSNEHKFCRFCGSQF